MLESHTQYPQKINVWAVILNDTLIGPFFIDGNLDPRAYKEIFRNQIVPRFEHIWILSSLIAGFEEGVKSRSPDLTPLDYFPCGYLKSKVYSTQPQSLDELQN